MQEELSGATQDRITDPRTSPITESSMEGKNEIEGRRFRARAGERALIYIPTLVMRVNSLVKD